MHMKPYIEFEPTKDDEFEQIGKVPTASVHKYTGKHWKQWVAILTKAGAATWTYQETVAYLKTKHELTPWWQHGVANGFEQAIGRRKEGQNAKGEYMVTTTKSLPCSVAKVWTLLTSEKGQELWLQPLSTISIEPSTQFETADGYFGEVRTLKKNRRLRMTWQDPNWEKKTTLELMLVPKPVGKSLLIFNHTQLKETKTQAVLRKRWKHAAEAIAKAIE